MQATKIPTKAFLLAAGVGTRLRPITNPIPKCLVPIKGKPLLGIWLDVFRKFNIREVVINLHAHADAVRQYVAESSDGLDVLFFEEPALLGSAGTLAANQGWVKRETSFWVFYADVLTNVDLEKMHRFHQRHKSLMTLGVYEVEDPGRCGIAVIDERGMIRHFVEKPKVPLGNLAFSGLMITNPGIFDIIPPKRPADLGFDIFPHLTRRMYAYRIRDYLLDVGTMENYKAAQAAWPGLAPSEGVRTC
jgi:mannose-1-phosphate guanylyltransferase